MSDTAVQSTCGECGASVPFPTPSTPCTAHDPACPLDSIRTLRDPSGIPRPEVPEELRRSALTALARFAPRASRQQLEGWLDQDRPPSGADSAAGTHVRTAYLTGDLADVAWAAAALTASLFRDEPDVPADVCVFDVDDAGFRVWCGYGEVVTFDAQRTEVFLAENGTDTYDTIDSRLGDGCTDPLRIARRVATVSSP